MSGPGVAGLVILGQIARQGEVSPMALAVSVQNVRGCTHLIWLSKTTSDLTGRLPDIQNSEQDCALPFVLFVFAEIRRKFYGNPRLPALSSMSRDDDSDQHFEFNSSKEYATYKIRIVIVNY